MTWIPSYGPEMRGGTAHCTVILSDDDIGSPIIREPTICIVMNPPSMDKYDPLVKPGGLLVVNSTLIRSRSERADINGCLRAGQRAGRGAGQRQDGQRRAAGRDARHCARSCPSRASSAPWTSTSRSDASISSSRTSGRWIGAWPTLRAGASRRLAGRGWVDGGRWESEIPQAFEQAREKSCAIW